MISLEELKEHAKKKALNLGQAEKDYFQEVILFILYREYGAELVFKGGTALTKCYGFDRFSEGLDFNVTKELNPSSVISSGLDSFYVEHEVEEKKYQNSINITCRIQGPLYNGSRLCKISIDLSIRQKTLLKPKVKKIGLMVEQLPSFNVVVMDKAEILAEKIRALFTRNKARDVYDIYYLLQDTTPDFDLIEKKLSFYSLKFSIDTLKQKLSEKEKIWDSELKHLTSAYPAFADARETISNGLNK